MQVILVKKMWNHKPSSNCVINELSEACLTLINKINDVLDSFSEEEVVICVPKSLFRWNPEEFSDTYGNNLLNTYKGQDVSLRFLSHGLQLDVNLKIDLETDCSRLESIETMYDNAECKSAHSINGVCISPRDARYFVAYLTIECRSDQISLMERELRF